ncbi:hypothetical protein SLE2022_376200 [Rubroshorea leprosula]
MFVGQEKGKAFSDLAKPVIAGGVELSFGIYLPNVELLAQDSEQKLLQCAHFCSKSMSSPASFSAEMYSVSSLLNRSEKSSKFKASVVEYFPV